MPDPTPEQGRVETLVGDLVAYCQHLHEVIKHNADRTYGSVHPHPFDHFRTTPRTECIDLGEGV